MKSKYIIFDLDDTLMYEIDYLKSAYFDIATKINNQDEYKLMLEKYFNGENVFDYLTEKYSFPKYLLINWYREHYPKISLTTETKRLLDFCKQQKYYIGLITDGRSITQRNKINALNIEGYFDKIVISEEFGSEKPDVANYVTFIQENIEQYYYIGDNTYKDFIAPNKLGWTTVAILDCGKNIHKQDFNLPIEYLPKFKIKKSIDLMSILE